MPRRNTNTALFLSLPWWVNACLAVAVYGFFTYVVPHLTVQNPMLKGLTAIGPAVAVPFTLLFAFFTLWTALHAWRRRRLLDTRTSLDSIKQMGWKDFEYLTGEAFRRRGYTVQENLHGGADGGVDLVLAKAGKRYLVQCKNWRTWTVGVAPVRELYGLVMAERAAGGILVCSGDFSAEARRFARGKPLELVDGPALVKLVAEVQVGQPLAPGGQPLAPGGQRQAPPAAEPPLCPQCHSVMVRRTAQRGQNRGQPFWGCSRFPACRGIRRLEA